MGVMILHPIRQTRQTLNRLQRLMAGLKKIKKGQYSITLYSGCPVYDLIILRIDYWIINYRINMYRLADHPLIDTY